MPGYISADGIEAQHQALLDWASLVTHAAGRLLLRRAVLRRRVARLAPAEARDGRSGRTRHRRRVRRQRVVDARGRWAGLLRFGDDVRGAALGCAAFRVARAPAGRRGDRGYRRDVPETAERLIDPADASKTERVAARELRPGDRIRVAAGMPIAADGTIVEGRSSVEEAMLTGESWPRARMAGDRVLAGSLNRESPLVVRVDAAGESDRRSRRLRG